MSLAAAVAVGGCASTAPPPSVSRKLEGIPPEDEAGALLHFSGLDYRLERLHGLGSSFTNELRRRLVAEAGTASATVSPELELLFDVVRDIAGRAYNPESLRSIVHDSIARGPAAERRAAAAHFSSELMTRALLEEKHADTPEGQKRVSLFLSLTKDVESRGEWVARGRRMVDASDEAALLTRLSFDVTAELTDALAPVLGAAQRASRPAPRAPQRDAFFERTRLALTLRAGYVLSRFDEGERDRMVRFWDSPAGRWFVIARREAVDAALAYAARTASSMATSYLEEGATESAPASSRGSLPE